MCVCARDSHTHYVWVYNISSLTETHTRGCYLLFLRLYKKRFRAITRRILFIVNNLTPVAYCTVYLKKLKRKEIISKTLPREEIVTNARINEPKEEKRIQRCSFIHYGFL